jgi:hypothetical protein
MSNWEALGAVVVFGGSLFAATALEGVRGAEIAMGLTGTTLSAWLLFRMAAFGSNHPAAERRKLAASHLSLLLLGLGWLTPIHFLLPYGIVHFAFMISGCALQMAARFAVPKKLFGAMSSG